MKESKEKTSTRTTVAKVGFLICLAMLLYPVVASFWNHYRSSKTMTNYETTVKEADTSVIDDMWAKAEAYNEELARTAKYVITQTEYEKDPTYEQLLDTNGLMGYIEIPCIDVEEGIYHYSSDDVLQKGIGHIHGSSLPVGGKSTHAVLTGHCGLPTQKYFTDLDKMKKGDRFYLHILNQTLAYQVDQIQVALPEDVDLLQIEPDRDLVTLVTCTPYGVNSHRLLVTGHRIPFTPDKNGKVPEKHRIRLDPGELVILIILVFFTILFLIRAIQNMQEKRKELVARRSGNDKEKENL